jgi:hypothetical protein
VELHRRRGQLEELFRLHPVFAELPPEGLQTLLGGLEEVEVAAGETVIEQDERPGAAYVVEDGKLRTRRDGRDLAFQRRGDVVGERSLFTDTPRAATVEAVSDARLLRLPAALFRDLLATYPDVAQRLGVRVAQYDYETVARVPLDFGDELLPADAQRMEAPLPDVGTVERRTPTAPEPDAVPLVSAAERTRKSRRVRVPLIHQIDEMDCGAACLAMVASAYGRPISLTRARDAADTNISGSSLAGIVRGAEQLGFEARTVKASKRSLDDLPLPAIAQHRLHRHRSLGEEGDEALARHDQRRDRLQRRRRGLTGGGVEGGELSQCVARPAEREQDLTTLGSGAHHGHAAVEQHVDVPDPSPLPDHHVPRLVGPGGGDLDQRCAVGAVEHRQRSLQRHFPSHPRSRRGRGRWQVSESNMATQSSLLSCRDRMPRPHLR